MISIDKGISFVKFSAGWCAPCKTLAKTIVIIEPEFSDVNFQEVDIDEASELTKEYGIRSVPTVILFKDGEEITRLVGNQKADTLRKALESVAEEQAA